MTKKVYIVWNEARNEGFITTDEGDAKYVRSGNRRHLSCPYTPTLGDQFRENYEGDKLTLQEIEISG